MVGMVGIFSPVRADSWKDHPAVRAVRSPANVEKLAVEIPAFEGPKLDREGPAIKLTAQFLDSGSHGSDLIRAVLIFQALYNVRRSQTTPGWIKLGQSAKDIAHGRRVTVRSGLQGNSRLAGVG